MLLNNRDIAGQIDDAFYWRLFEHLERSTVLDYFLVEIMLRTVKVSGFVLKENQYRVLRVLLDGRNVRIAALIRHDTAVQRIAPRRMDSRDEEFKSAAVLSPSSGGQQSSALLAKLVDNTDGETDAVLASTASCSVRKVRVFFLCFVVVT
jgi:hypothetical protein